MLLRYAVLEFDRIFEQTLVSVRTVYMTGVSLHTTILYKKILTGNSLCLRHHSSINPYRLHKAAICAILAWTMFQEKKA